jgi:hypothetical protein
MTVIVEWVGFEWTAAGIATLNLLSIVPFLLMWKKYIARSDIIEFVAEATAVV